LILTSHKKSIAEQQLKELQLQNSLAQKQVLMQQLQPHFLFNSLSVLKSLINTDKTKAEEYVLQLSDFLRYTVQSSQVDLISIEKELEFVQDYIELQKVRYDQSFTYDIEVPDDVRSKQLPILALQTLVENIFKHNYFSEKKPLYFSIRYMDHMIEVQNSKVSVRLTEKTHTGLANLDKRYQLITHKNIQVIDQEETFIVRIPVVN
jgi:two-component system, LytTR family, sensor kinase